MDELDELRGKVALACRILAGRGLVEGILGHVSARVGDGAMLIRCRGPEDRGLRFSERSDVRLVSLDGEHLEDGAGFDVPNEHPIHGELYRRRPDVGAVVHAHPWPALLCGLAGLELRPAFGAFNIPAMRLALDGVPVFPRACLVTRADVAAEMLDAMGDGDVCLMRGHGVTVAGATVEAATVRAIDLDVLTRVTLELARLGVRDAPAISPDDLAELPDLGRGFNEERVWRHVAADAADLAPRFAS